MYNSFHSRSHTLREESVADICLHQKCICARVIIGWQEILPYTFTLDCQGNIEPWDWHIFFYVSNQVVSIKSLAFVVVCDDCSVTATSSDWTGLILHHFLTRLTYYTTTLTPHSSNISSNYFDSLGIPLPLSNVLKLAKASQCCHIIYGKEGKCK